MSGRPDSGLRADAGEAGAAAAGPWPFRIRFTGSGAEYFRIWIVNLLLLVVTFGLYYPWARVRRLRYFYSNTWVEGGPQGGDAATLERHALDFHARPRQMFGATVVIALAFAVYTIGSQISPILATVLAVAVTGLTPVVVRAGLRFRLANTSWRGLRFGFDGSLAEAFRVYWPIVIPMLLFAAAMLVTSGGGETGGGNETSEGGAAGDDGPTDDAPGSLLGAIGLAAGLLVASVVSGYLILPWLWLRLARYQHSHFIYGTLRSGFTLAGRDVLRLILRVTGVSLLALVVVAVLAGAAAVPIAGQAANGIPPQMPAPQGWALKAYWAVFIPLFVVGVVIAGRLVVLNYLSVQQQNVVWSATRSDGIAFRSHLSFGRLVRVDTVNWVLTILTVGLYRPFADIAMARLRLEAVSGAFRHDPAEVIGRERERLGALGDIGADLFDLGGAF